MMTAPEMAFIEQQIGHQERFGRAMRSTICAGWRTFDRMKEQGITLEDIGLHDHQEVIILRREKNDIWNEGEDVEYEDTDQIRLMRQQMIDINRWLADAEIDFDESVLKGSGRTIDITDRHLRRVFNQGRFDRGGRLFGGFWQKLSKKDRLDGTVLAGWAVSELDFGQMNPRIVYGLCGAQPAEGDAYAIPGLEEHRSGIKKVMNAMLFSTKQLSRMPQGVRQLFAERHRVADVVKAIQAAHPSIKDRWFTGVGYEAMFIESQIIVDILMQLRSLDIPALPIHDSILIPSEKKDVAKKIMTEAFYQHTGVHGVVTESIYG